MRGKVCEGGLDLIHKGITPAYAGKSDGAYIISDFLRGSPPPMRGKVHIYMLVLILNRITPAYAGKSAAHFFG